LEIRSCEGLEDSYCAATPSKEPSNSVQTIKENEGQVHSCETVNSFPALGNTQLKLHETVISSSEKAQWKYPGGKSHMGEDQSNLKNATEWD